MGDWTQEEYEARVAATKAEFDALGDYPSRQWIVPPSERGESYSKALDRLEEETSPLLGEVSARGKDLAAFQALSGAAKLGSGVAGWAIAHQIGLAITGSEFLPLAPNKTKQLPDYQERREFVDSHDHEKVGSEAIRSGKPLDPLIARRALINILRPLAGSFLPAVLAGQAIEALEALDFGETTEMLKPIKDGRKRQLRELRLQLRALGHVEFRYEYGLQKLTAEKIVADAFGVEPKTLRTWGRRVREELGNLRVSFVVEGAKNLASNAALHRNNPSRRQDFDYSYNDKILKRDGLAYQKLLGFSGRK